METDTQLLKLGAWVQLISTVIAGPLLVWIIHLLAPQPLWSNSTTFADHYSWLQFIPYWAGFILIIGNVLFVVAAARRPGIRESALYPLAIISVSVYAALSAFNYIIQVGYIPIAVKSPTPALAIFSMVNPGSIAVV